MKHKKYIIGGLIVCAALGYLIYVLLGSSLTYYNTVSELKDSGDSVYDQKVRVKGEVVSDSIVSDIDNLTLTFTITDGNESLNVFYEGSRPDNFTDQIEVVLEGTLNSTDSFHAVSILTKCPSKYEAEE